MFLLSFLPFLTPPIVLPPGVWPCDWIEGLRAVDASDAAWLRVGVTTAITGATVSRNQQIISQGLKSGKAQTRLCCGFAIEVGIFSCGQRKESVFFTHVSSLYHKIGNACHHYEKKKQIKIP